jgi:hypothetical protein
MINGDTPELDQIDIPPRSTARPASFVNRLLDRLRTTTDPSQHVADKADRIAECDSAAVSAIAVPDGPAPCFPSDIS